MVILPTRLEALSHEGRGDLCGIVTDLFGTPLESAAIQAPGGARVVTGPDGQYCLKDLPAGNVIVQVTCPGFARREGTLQIHAGRAGTADFALVVGRLSDRPPVTIEGVVTYGQLGGLAEARITAFCCVDRSVTVVANTDSHGKFTLPLNEPGQYCLTTWKSGYWTDVRVVAVAAGTTARRIRVAVRLKPLSMLDQ